jgi:hypothetical protein
VRLARNGEVAWLFQFFFLPMQITLRRVFHEFVMHSIGRQTRKAGNQCLARIVLANRLTAFLKSARLKKSG